MHLLILAYLVVLIIFLASYSPPRDYTVKFSNGNPPVIAWINSPSSDATEKVRTVKLPDSTYTIPPEMAGHFVLVYDWVLDLTTPTENSQITIPSKFPTDFASIPKALHSFISPLTNKVYASIVHDYLYRNPIDIKARALTKSQVDQIFYWGMRFRGVTRPTAGLMYWAVRLFGGSSYIRS